MNLKSVFPSYSINSLISSSDDPRRSSMYVEGTSSVAFSEQKLRGSASMDRLNMISSGSTGDKVLQYIMFAFNNSVAYFVLLVNLKFLNV